MTRASSGLSRGLLCPPQWAHDVEYTLECRHDVITLKTTSIRRRNSVVEMTSIFLVDATSKKRRNSVVEMTSIFLVDVTLKLSHN